MSANATTWFYSTPEVGRPYFIAERVNHSFWWNRINNVYFSCVHAEAPFRLVGKWGAIEVELEFEVNAVFILRMSQKDQKFLTGCEEILGFKHLVSYMDADGRFVAEWYAKDADKRLREVQGNPTFQNVRKNK